MRTRSLSLFFSFPTKPLTDWLPSGDGLIAHRMIAELAERGHRIHVATPYADLHHPLSEQITVHQMNTQKEQPRPGAFAYMRWTRHILNRVRTTMQVDLIHELNPVFSLRSLAFVDSGIPVVLGPHSSRWPINLDSKPLLLSTNRRRITQMFKNVCVDWQHQCAQAILLSTQAALNNVVQPERFIDRLFILPPGIDLCDFSPGPDRTADNPTVLFLANVVVRKGIFSLLEAFDSLSRRMPRVRLVIAGDGPALAAVKEKVAASHYSDRVQFLGRVDRADIPNILRQCTVYCLPSHGEPFGMSALEAMACGKPLIVTDAGGLSYMVSDQGGRRVPVKDPIALAGALEELLSNPELCHGMGAYNRKQVEAQYAWPIVASRLENIYQQVLGSETKANPDRITHLDISEYRRRTAASSISGQVSRPRILSEKEAVRI